MPELLFEIGTEEIPAGYLNPALSFISERAKSAIEEARLSPGAITVEGTPRRMVLRVSDVAGAQPDREEEVTGPKASIAWDADGNLTKAGMGFLRGRGVAESDAKRVQSDKGEVIGATVFEKGKSAQEVLPEILSEMIKKIPFQKTMRWSGRESFARPLRWIVAMLDEESLDVRFGDVQSRKETYGHRFHAPGPFEVTHANVHAELLKEKSVLLNVKERREIILQKAEALAKSVGGRLVSDDDLLEEVANLVEFPWPVLGEFEEKFLAMPRELLLSVMKEHQRYFAIENDKGELLANFVVVAGSKPPDEQHLAQGNARVLRSRFEDGAFYFESDQKLSLDEHRAKLSNVIFQRDLGTLLQKSERIEKVATGFAKASGASDELLAAVARSAQLCKADLVAGVVEEFPELQGVMGRRYSSSESELVREALEEHYWPLTSQSRLPKNKAAQFIALGDRLDTMTGIIGIGKLPKGSADPFALRRAAVAVVRICMERGIDISLSSLVKDAAAAHHAELKSDTVDETIEFIKGRARGVLENIFDGLGRDVAGAVLAADSDNLPALRERTQAIYDLKRQDAEGFAKLAAVFKRVNNVLRQAHDDKIDTPAGLEHVVVNESEHENALIEGVKALIGTEEKGYGERAKVLSTLWPLLSVYFDNVMVRHDDEKIRNSRLSLMATIQRSIQDLADFTMIHAD